MSAASGNGPIIPRDVLKRSDLSAIDKLLFAYLADRDRFFRARGRELRMGVTAIGEDVGVDGRTVRRRLRELARRGLLALSERPGRAFVIRVVDGDPGQPVRGSGAGGRDNSGQVVRGSKARPRTSCPDTPDKLSGHPGHVVRGTPDKLSDDRNSRELEERAVVATDAETTAAAAPRSRNSNGTSVAERLVRCWHRMHDERNAGAERPIAAPLASRKDAAHLGEDLDALRFFPDDESLVAEMRRVARCYSEKELRVTFRGVVGQLGQPFPGTTCPDPVLRGGAP